MKINLLFIIIMFILLSCNKKEIPLDPIEVDSVYTPGAIEDAAMLSMNPTLLHSNFSSVSYGFSIIELDTNKYLISVDELISGQETTVLYLIEIGVNKEIVFSDRLELENFYYVQLLSSVPDKFIMLVRDFYDNLNIIEGCILNSKIELGIKNMIHNNISSSPSIASFNDGFLVGYCSKIYSTASYDDFKGIVAKCSINNGILKIDKETNFSERLEHNIHLLPLSEGYFIIGHSTEKKSTADKYQMNFKLAKYSDIDGFTFFEDNVLCEYMFQYQMGEMIKYEAMRIDNHRFVITYIDEEKYKIFINTYTQEGNSVKLNDSFSINTSLSYYLSMSNVIQDEFYLAYESEFPARIRNISVRDNLITSSPPWIFTEGAHWLKTVGNNDFGLIVYHYRERYQNNGDSFIGIFNKSSLFY